MDTNPTRTSSHGASGAVTVFQLKREAEQLQHQAAATGGHLKRAAALEQVARAHGFKDWNAAAATASTVAARQLDRVFAFDLVDAALPDRPMRIYTAGDLAEHKIIDAIAELYRWAQQLEFIATKVSPAHRRSALSLIGGRQPYVLVRETARWPDGLFRLCDRGYDPIKGPTFTQSDLDEIGIPTWEDRFGSHGGGSTYSVINDDVCSSRDEVLLRRGARLLTAIAAQIDAKHFGKRPATDS